MHVLWTFEHPSKKKKHYYQCYGAFLEGTGAGANTKISDLEPLNLFELEYKIFIQPYHTLFFVIFVY